MMSLGLGPIDLHCTNCTTYIEVILVIKISASDWTINISMETKGVTLCNFMHIIASKSLKK